MSLTIDCAICEEYVPEYSICDECGACNDCCECLLKAYVLDKLANREDTIIN
jgi:hypothetical protein